MSGEGRYEGESNDKGEPHGSGTFYYDNGDKYEGQWKDGKAHGYGVLEEANGNRYEGGWKDDLLHGEGTIYLSGGMRLIGQFDQSNFVKGEWWSDEAAGPVGSDIPITIEPTAGNYEISYHDGIMRLIDKEGNISWKLN